MASAGSGSSLVSPTASEDDDNPSHSDPLPSYNGLSESPNANGNGVATNATRMDGITPANPHLSATDALSNGISDLKIDKVELVRVISQAIRSLGYNQSAKMLEEEAGVEAMSKDMRLLREIVLEGKWNELEDVLKNISVFRTDSDAKAARFVLYEQKFLELLESGNTAEALDCLRNHLTLYAPSPKALHRLPLLHMCTNSDELRKRANWSGTGYQSRLVVLKKLRNFIPTSHLLGENRLETLLSQALELQKRCAKYPYTIQTNVGLLEDLIHDPDRLPKKPLFTLKGHQDEVWFVQFSNNGRYLASASKDKTVCIWDVEKLLYGASSNGDMSISPASSSEDALKYRLTGHQEFVCFLAWSPDDTKLLSCGSDFSIVLWDIVSGESKKTFKKHVKQVMACVWMPHGRSFFSGSEDKKVFEWDAESGEIMQSYPVTREVMDLVLTKDGKKLVCCLSDSTIQFYNTENQQLINTLKESLLITSCSLARDERSLVVNLTSNSSDQEKNLMDSEIHIWDIENNHLQKKLSGFKQCRFVIRGAFGGYNQMFVLCGSEDKLVYVWERHTGELLLRLKGHTATVNSVHWSPTDPQLFASGSDDNTVILWGVEAELRGPAHQVPELTRTL